MYKHFKPYGQTMIATQLPSRTSNLGLTSRPYVPTMSITKQRRLKKNRNSFRSLTLAQQPAKHYAQSSTTSLTHNTINTVIPTAGITQGTSNTTRLADHVELCAIKIKGTFNTAVASNGYSYRILVGYTGEEFNLPTVLGSGLGATELFIPNTDANWEVNGIINPKAFTCIHDSTYDINSQITAVSDISSFAFTVKLDTKFDYQAAGSIYGKSRNLAVVVISSVVGGVSGTTSTGLVVMAYDLIFK